MQWQLAVACFMGLVGLAHSAVAAGSVFVGAIICSVSYLAAALWYIRTTSRARQPRTILRMAYLSELIKLLTTIALFVIAFLITDIWLPLAMFGGFLVAQLVSWWAPWFTGSR